MLLLSGIAWGSRVGGGGGGLHRAPSPHTQTQSHNSRYTHMPPLHNPSSSGGGSPAGALLHPDLHSLFLPAADSGGTTRLYGRQRALFRRLPLCESPVLSPALDKKFFCIDFRNFMLAFLLIFTGFSNGSQHGRSWEKRKKANIG